MDSKTIIPDLLTYDIHPYSTRENLWLFACCACKTRFGIDLAAEASEIAGALCTRCGGSLRYLSSLKNCLHIHKVYKDWRDYESQHYELGVCRDCLNLVASNHSPKFRCPVCQSDKIERLYRTVLRSQTPKKSLQREGLWWD